MDETRDGLSIARQRIAEEAERRTGSLDLRNLGLATLPGELFALSHLRRLDLGSDPWVDSRRRVDSRRPNLIGAQVGLLARLTRLEVLSLRETDLTSLEPLAGLTALQSLDCRGTPVSDLAPLASLTALQSLNCSETPVSDLAPLASLTALQSLNCSWTRVSDLAPLASLTALQSLVCSSTQVSDLAPLASLTALQSLVCSSTQVSDLAPLASLTALQSLDCRGTQVSDLAPLAPLTALHSLDCRFTQVSDLAPLASLTALQSLYCSSTQVSDLAPLASLTALQSLVCSYTPVSDLAPLASLTALQSLDCSGTEVSDLAPLASLTALQSLDCSSTQVSDLAPLASLTALQSLDCSETPVSDLAPLASLTALQSLNCSETPVSDLAPLASLTALQSLNCSWTRVSDLAPLASLTALQSLNCWNTRVSDLAPLASLTALQSLNCRGTPVSDLAPLASLTALQSLVCSSTQVSDLAPLASLTALQSLDCSSTQVSDLAPLASLTALQSLDCSGCRLTNAPEKLWHLPSLETLQLYECHVAGIPAEVLSESEDYNCLELVRAHLRDRASGAEPIRDLKLIVLGNGRVGKTQICRRLRGETYDDTIPSTHGIQVTSATLAGTSGAPADRLNIWDFGGQDLYHGTHALFIRTRALYLLVWSPETEGTQEQHADGTVFRNHRLEYWGAYIRHLAESSSPVLVVQTRCDRPENEALRPPLSDETLSAFRFRKMLHYSAKFDRGRAALNEALHDAAHWLHEQHGIATIGVGRLKVQRRLEEMRDADAARPPDQRRYRTITQRQFRRYCDQAGGVSSAKHLLSYLHNAGIVFHRPGLFDDSIVLDQSWALDAIYAVFHRDKSLRWLQRSRGRFVRSDLQDLVWQDYSVAEADLFISMMQSCGICFVYKEGHQGNEETEYIVPELLPERTEVETELAEKWDPAQPSESATFDYTLLHPGLMRGVIARIGSEAGVNALYWRGGVCVYEKTTRSHALIEQEAAEDDWRGHIRVETQGGQARALLDELLAWVEREGDRIGLRPTVALSEATHRRAKTPATRMPDTLEAVHANKPGLAFAQPAAPGVECFVSYSWGDATPEGREREAIVDQLCEAATAAGIRIERDKTTLRTGDRISQFMQRLGAGDRVFVILSDKYLRSGFCMYELFEIWRNSKWNDLDFLGRIRVYALPDAAIFTPEQRFEYAISWKQRFEKFDALTRQHGADILGPKDFNEFRRMKQFYLNVSEVLATIADIVLPHTFEQLQDYGLADLFPRQTPEKRS